MEDSLTTERDRRIFEEEFSKTLPDRIFDSHVHLIRRSSYPADFTFGERSYLKKFNGEFTLDDFRTACREVLPGKEVWAAGFGNPDLHADRSDAAGFGADNRTVFGLRLVSPVDSVEAVDADFRKYRLVGLKPYPDLAVPRPGQPVALADFFSDQQLEYIDRRGLVCVIHIPGKERLNSAATRGQMVELCRKCPAGNFIFAHIGRAYFLRGVVGLLDELAECPNAWLDTAMVNHPGVLRYAFDHFPRERILFGSDAPISLLHGKSVEINHQYAYLTDENFDLGTVIYDSSGRVEYTLFLYEQFRAVLACGLSKRELADFFFQNACDLYRKTAERMFEK